MLLNDRMEIHALSEPLLTNLADGPKTEELTSQNDHQGITCPICYVIHRDEKEIIKLRCGHVTCRECMTSNLNYLT